MNFCLCGAEAGYLHAADCPRPLYRCSESQQEKWERDRQALKQEATNDLDPVHPDRPRRG